MGLAQIDDEIGLSVAIHVASDEVHAVGDTGMNLPGDSGKGCVADEAGQVKSLEIKLVLATNKLVMKSRPVVSSSKS